VRNPHNTDCIPGGSSGGSGAAVAAGISFMAMGSDTGGSIRIPASFCGTVGLKPTFGRVSRYGAFPLGFTLDHMGPLTRTARDAAVTLNAIAGYDPKDDSSSRRPVEDFDPGPEPSIRGLRVGVPETFYLNRVDPGVERAVRRMIEKAERLGANLVSVRVPDIGALNTLSRMILLAEASATVEPYMDRRDEIGADVRALMDQGRFVRATDYINAQRVRRQFQREFNIIWKQADCLVTPTTPTSAPKIGQATATIGDSTEDVRLMATRFVRGINVLGWPAVALPCGTDDSGMPVSLQIVGPPFAEASILRVAAALEQT
jgi:aspartyl-tRNA(Asn)/glutamyl-tRNA(Gln) amidotransferase subunit A